MVLLLPIPTTFFFVPSHGPLVLADVLDENVASAVGGRRVTEAALVRVHLEL